MKFGVYDIINNPLPQLHQLKEVEIKGKSLDTNKDIIDILNKDLLMDKLSSEHMYALGITYGRIPKGIIQVGVGKFNECPVNMRDMAIGLLLIGAEQFMCFHNHPGGTEDPSPEDYNITEKFKKLGDLIGIEFLDHIMITQGVYVSCKPETTDTIFGMEV